jgi:hypothetical protein
MKALDKHREKRQVDDLMTETDLHLDLRLARF